MTEKQEHTALPWASATAGPVMLGYQQPFAISSRDIPNLIAGCFGDVRGGDETAKANAALIVRAVNSHHAMLEALEELIPRFKACIMSNGTDEEYAEAAVAKARAAIRLGRA